MSGLQQAKTAPCQAACPAGVDVPRYVRHIRDGRFLEALAVVRERIPFPLVCGYACFHPCESKCARQQLDAPVAIRMLKRVVAEQGQHDAVPLARLAATGRKAAVIGAGPCGLTAAFYLALQGHEVTVFEALERSGGMLRFGIPAYRLPEAIIDADIRVIERSGVKIQTGTRVASAEALLQDGFGAVLIASGAWRSVKLGIPGEDAAHVVDGLTFLKQVNTGAAPKPGARVVVIGGGNTAIDAARASRRLGAQVTQLYRRSRPEMPAAEEEIADAIAEGVRIEYLCAPVRVNQGGVTCVRMALGVADESGRPRPLPVAGSDYTTSADTVIVAIGQQVELPASSVVQETNRTARVETQTLATSVHGIFAAGDAVLGPASIIGAIAQGRTAASAMDRFLGGSGIIDRPTDSAVASEVAPAMPHGTPRNVWQTLPLAQRQDGFALVEQAYDKQTARHEAMRCLSCDRVAFDVEVNPVVCKDCGYCQEVCRLDVFERSEEFNASGYQSAVATRAERCVGCLNCLYICPDFAITLTQRTAV